jgi:hypothetical protein
MTEAFAAGLRTERLGPVTLVREAIGRIVAAPVAFAVVWLAWSTAGAGVQLAAGAAKVSLVVPNANPSYFAVQAAIVLSAGLAGAFGLRIALAAKAPGGGRTAGSRSAPCCWPWAKPPSWPTRRC